MKLLRIDGTIQGARSSSSPLADLVLEPVTTRVPELAIVRRHLGRDPLPSHAWALAVAAAGLQQDQLDPPQREARALAGVVADELAAADAALLALPLYNWGVSQHTKTWIDLAMIGAAPGTRLLDGKPVVLVVTRGGAYGPGMPKEGWDYATGYARRILAEIWGGDLTVVERELTLVGVNPAMDALSDQAAAAKSAAELAATAAGHTLAERLRTMRAAA